MGAVGVVVLALGGAQQGERPLRGQRGPRQHDLEQDAHLGHGQGRAFFPPKRKRAWTRKWCARKLKVTW